MSMLSVIENFVNYIFSLFSYEREQFPMTEKQINDEAYLFAYRTLVLREGFKNKVYLDSEGHLTVGIGHLVLPHDNLSLNDWIDDIRVYTLFNEDIAKAFQAGKIQARELQIYTPKMIGGLTSVNFQLGVNWRDKFINTWQRMLIKNKEGAIKNLRASLWYKQTPTRVNDFINVIESEM